MARPKGTKNEKKSTIRNYFFIFIIILLTCLIFWIWRKSFYKIRMNIPYKTTSQTEYKTVTRENGEFVIRFLDTLPEGVIFSWAGSTLPDGWVFCDGENGTPDLRGRFILGSTLENNILPSNTRKNGVTQFGTPYGGSETVKLVPENIPDHIHGTNIRFGSDKKDYGIYADSRVGCNPAETSYTGNPNPAPHDNVPPYYVLAFITNTGDIPSNKQYPKIAQVDSQGNIILIPALKKRIPLGVISPFNDTTPPKDWEFCNKSPDLSKKFILGLNTTPDLSSDNRINKVTKVGDIGGVSEVTLTMDQLPSHKHNIWVSFGKTDGGCKVDLAPYFDSGKGKVSQTTYTGGNKPHNNIPPFCSLFYMTKTGETSAENSVLLFGEKGEMIYENLSAYTIPKKTIVYTDNNVFLNNTWAYCNGKNGTPDLRGRFVVQGDEKSFGTIQGEEYHVLTTDEIPSHNHTYSFNTCPPVTLAQNTNTDCDGTGATNSGFSGQGDGPVFTYNSVGNVGHYNLPPFRELSVFMKI